MANISKINLPNDNNNPYNIDAVTVNGHTVNKDVPSNAKFTDTLFYFSISKDESSISSTSVAPLSVSRGIGLQVEVDPDGVTPTDISLFTTSDAYSYTSNANGNTGYMLITIKPETSWMLSFTLNLYGNYNAYSVEISGYNYSTNHWYKPNAQLLYSSDGETSKTVYFGYTGNLKLWVAVPKSSYQGLSITNITNGHAKITNMASDIFDISYVSSLPGTTQITVNAVNNSVINLIYPVGSIYMSVTNANPGTWMVGTTWVAWGSGRVPVGVKTSDNDFATVEKTGGGKTTSYTPAGTNSGCAVTKHTYTPAGTNTGCAVTKHTYTPAGTVGNTTLKVSQIPSHTHNTCVEHSGTWGLTGTKTVASGTGRYSIMSPEVSHAAEAVTGATGGGGSHTHTFTGTQATLSHTVTQPTFTGTQATLSHTVTQPKFTGTANNISTVQPYITCYMWKRTA